MNPLSEIILQFKFHNWLHDMYIIYFDILKWFPLSFAHLKCFFYAWLVFSWFHIKIRENQEYVE